MNKITFDKIIRTRPEKFAFVQPQDPEMPIVPDTGNNGNIVVFNEIYRYNYYLLVFAPYSCRFAFCLLYTSSQVFLENLAGNLLFCRLLFLLYDQCMYVSNGE